MQNNPNPVEWAERALEALRWPAIVISAFWLGRYVQRLETRLIGAEGHLQALIERHLPHVHRALADIKGKIETIQMLIQRGK